MNVAMHLQRSGPLLAKLISFFCSEISRTLLGGEHKPSMSFTKVDIVNLFLARHVLCITDDHFILSRISIFGLELMLGYCASIDSFSAPNGSTRVGFGVDPGSTRV